MSSDAASAIEVLFGWHHQPACVGRAELHMTALSMHQLYNREAHAQSMHMLSGPPECAEGPILLMRPAGLHAAVRAFLRGFQWRC